MKILALDSSGTVASVALLEDDILTAEYTVNNKLTHSQTLMPMLESVLERAGWELASVDVIALAAGPGSFTGLRIGSGSAKGLAFALGIPIAQISTLEAMAYGLYGSAGFICPMMDARRRQVYTAVYCFEDKEAVCGDGMRSESGEISTIKEPCAASVEEISAFLNSLPGPVTLLGDGVPVYRQALEEMLTVPFRIAPPCANRQRAANVGSLAMIRAKRGGLVSAAEHTPVYLRMSQAERELRNRSLTL